MQKELKQNPWTQQKVEATLRENCNTATLSYLKLLYS